MELSKGEHRNDILPSEAALASDICINHKIGGTAGLESAVFGVRSILLDPFNSYCFYDNLFNETDIIFKDINNVINAIIKFRIGLAHLNIGDWSSILHNFDPYLDGKASFRFKKTIQSYMDENRELQLTNKI